jgi:four helix bundle protein
VQSNFLLEEPQKIYNIKHGAFQFFKKIILFVNEIKVENFFHSVFNQLVRSAVSIGANQAEAIPGSSKKDFLNFYFIALKSANETKYRLCLIGDLIQSDKIKSQLCYWKQTNY